MASSKEYVDFIFEQCEGLSARAMMGEYVLYYCGKVVGGVYDIMSKVKENTGQTTTFAEKDREFREALWQLVDLSGRSERQICQQLGHNSGYINKLLNGNADLSHTGLLELAEYFKVEIGALFGEK